MTKQTESQDDPLFYADALMGRVLNVLMAIGAFCALVAFGYFSEVWK